jgi:hypothetical protein
MDSYCMWQTLSSPNWIVHHHHIPVTRSAGRRVVKADAAPHRVLHWSLLSATRNWNVQSSSNIEGLDAPSQDWSCCHHRLRWTAIISLISVQIVFVVICECTIVWLCYVLTSPCRMKQAVISRFYRETKHLVQFLFLWPGCLMKLSIVVAVLQKVFRSLGNVSMRAFCSVNYYLFFLLLSSHFCCEASQNTEWFMSPRWSQGKMSASGQEGCSSFLTSGSGIFKNLLPLWFIFVGWRGDQSTYGLIPLCNDSLVFSACYKRWFWSRCSLLAGYIGPDYCQSWKG